MKIVFATGNPNKIREIREIIADPSVEVVSMAEAGVSCDPDEDGATFEENARIKARACAALLSPFPENTVVCSDDSGLCVDALDGAPGVQSARWMGYDTPYEVKNARIIELLADTPDEKRGAQFVCAVAAVLPDGTCLTETGVMEGRIARRASGAGGFGYDPIFFLPELGMTSADISEEEKNALSHRGKAMRAMAERLRALIPDAAETPGGAGEA